MSLHPSTKRRLLWSLAIFPAYLAATFLGDMRAAGNPFELGLPHSLFGVIAAAFFYPLIIVFQAGIYRLVRHLTRSPSPAFSRWEFAGVALWCVLLLSAFLRTSDAAYYRRFVSSDLPASLQQFQSRHYSGFGSTVWAVAFRIDPADFPKVISRYEYTQEPATGRFTAMTQDPALRLDLPDEPVAERYHCSPHGTHGPAISVYTNASHDLVFLSGSSE